MIINRLVFCLLGLFQFLTLFNGFSQTINGKFPLLANNQIKLEGFNGFKTYAITNAKVSENGRFVMNYSKTDYGIGYLIAEDKKPFFVILCGEDIEIIGEAFTQAETIKILKGKENQLFSLYAGAHPKREQALSAWSYLEKIYAQDSLFSIHKTPCEAIKNEKQRIKTEDKDFIDKLDSNTYVSWFLPTRKLVSSVSTVAQYRAEEIPSTINAFRQMDYTDSRLYKSGLLKDAIENHFWLIENSGRPLDSVFVEMQTSIDFLVKNLISDEKKLNEITDFLFDLLERHSLFKASEYLALKVLNEVSCTIDGNLAKQLETYRKMKKGSIAPDINFAGYYTLPGSLIPVSPKKLSEIKSEYTLVVFGASWCPKCKEELPQISKSYSSWKSNGVEVVFVSLDEEKSAFEVFAGNFPFFSMCDYKKWNSPVVQDYYVFGTPTMFLLNSKREIVLRPNSVKQMDTWVDWYLVKGNN